MFNLVDPDPPPSLPPFIVADTIPKDVIAFIGTGGLGKSTLLLNISIRVALGLPVFSHEVLRPGPVVYVSAEDDNEVIHWRLMNIASAMGLSESQRQDLALPGTQLMITSLVGTGRKLVVNDGHGNFVITSLVDEIIELYRDVHPAMIILDPLQQLAMGLETAPNEAMREVVTAARRIKAALGCAVIIVHHVSKDVQRNRIIDHHSGRGGSALGDDARAVFVMVSMNDQSARKYGIDADDDDLESGRYLEIHVPKLSHASKPGKPIVLFRTGNGFHFEEIPVQAPADRTAALRDAAIQQDRDDELAVLTYLEASKGRHNVTSLEDHAHDVGIPEKRIRRAAHRLIDCRTLQEVSLPQEERQGRRQSYLALASSVYQSGKDGS